MSNNTRWDPFQEMLTLREAMSQLLEDSVVSPATVRRGQSFVPALDLSETADGYIVEASLPGLRAEDLEITLENNVLTIRGEVRQEKDERKRHFHRVERRFGSFQRAIGLPTTVKGDAISATLEHGILRLEIPKAEEVKPRKINVTIGSGQALEVSNN